MNTIDSLKLITRSFLTGSKNILGLYKSKLQALAKNGDSIILMYHRIISPECVEEYVEPGMYVTPKTFEMHLRTLKQCFQMVELSKICEPDNQSSGKPKCAITFDDGWLDFYENAYPLLSKYNISSTVFLPTDYIDTKKWFWTDRLATLLKKSSAMKKKSIKGISNQLIQQIMNFTGSLENKIDASIKLLKSYPLDRIENILIELSDEIGYSDEECNRAFLNWNEIRELQLSGLVSFGSHTAGHLILTNESKNRVLSELEKSKEILLNKCGINEENNTYQGNLSAGIGSLSFCYPNGGFNNEIAAQVKNCGYHCAVTTKRGVNKIDSDRFTLKRVGIHEDMTGSKSLLLDRILK